MVNGEQNRKGGRPQKDKVIRVDSYTSVYLHCICASDVLSSLKQKLLNLGCRLLTTYLEFANLGNIQ